MRKKELGKKTFLRVSALLMSAVMAVNFNLPNAKAEVIDTMTEAYGDEDDLTGTKSVSDFTGFKSALLDKTVNHIIIENDIEINSKKIAQKEQMEKAAYLVADRNLLIESKDGAVYTIKRTGGDMLPSILEVEGDGDNYDSTKVTIKNLVLDGGAVWNPSANIQKRGNSFNKSKENSGAAGRAIIGVSYKGTLNLGEGAVLQNSDCTSNIRVNGEKTTSYCYGGAVRVEFTYTEDKTEIQKKMGGGTVNVLDGSKITDCKSENIGGAIGAYNNAFVNMYGGTICNCYSGMGGAIGCTYRSATDSATAAHLYVSGGNFINCYSEQGGAFYVSGESNVQILAANFEKCHADKGSIIYFDGSGKLYIANSDGITYTECSGRGDSLNNGVNSATLYKIGNVTVEAPIVRKVSFISDNKEINTQYILAGQSLQEAFPSIPSEEEKVFLGWYSDEKFSVSSLFTANTEVNSDMNVYARWHKHHLSSVVSWDETTFTLKCDGGDGYECDSYPVNTVKIDAADVSYDGLQYSDKNYSVQGNLNDYEGYRIGKPVFYELENEEKNAIKGIPVDAGKYVVSVNIESPESASYIINKEFEIKPKDLEKSMVTATNDDEGNAVVNVCDGTTNLVLDKDYSVSVVDKDEKHEITVIGINNYTGKVETKIDIEKKNGGNGNDDGNGGNGNNNGNGGNGNNNGNGGNGNNDGNGGNGNNNGNGGNGNNDGNGGNGNNDGNGGNGNNNGNDDDEKPGNSGNDDIDPNRNGNGEIVVTFNPNGGSCEVKSLVIKKGEQIPAMPVANWNRYVFASWVDENNVEVNDLSAITKDTVLTAKWENITVVTKQKINIANVFEKELASYTDSVQKDCIAKGKKFTKSKLKYRYKVLSKADFANTVSRNSISSNKMMPGKASASKSGLVNTLKSGTVAVMLQYKVKEGKKWVWKNLADEYLFIAIEKPIVVKAHSKTLSGVGQTLNLNEILMYEYSDKVGSVPNYASYNVVSKNTNIATVDPKSGIITATGKGKTKITVTYRIKIGQKKDGSDKFSTIKKNITIKVK